MNQNGVSVSDCDYDSSSTDTNLMKYEVYEKDKDKSISLLKNIEQIENDIDKKVIFNPSSFNNSDFLSKINFSSISSDLRFVLPIYISCPNCKENFSLKLHNFTYMNLECSCKLTKNCTFDDFLSKFCSSEVPNLGCKIHTNSENEQKIFIKYCKDCKVDLCEECLNAIGLYNNDTGKHTAHELHDLIDLLDNKNDIEETKNLLLDLKLENNNIKNLILNLLENYEKSPSYKAYKTILISKNFLKNNNNINIVEDLKFEEFKIINSIKSLKENINSSNSIYKIQIDGNRTKESIDDLNMFENKEFNELKILQMNNIKLKNIDGLTNCSFPILKKLIIGCNELNDDCVNVVKKLKLPKIKFISFFDNKITSPEIFGQIEKYQTLEKFFIGNNLFDINKLPNSNIKYNFPSSLMAIGLSNCFLKETNKFIVNNLNIENIKKLYVTGNYFDTLKPFENIEFNQLEEFFMKGDKNKGYLTDIKEVNFLKGKTNIEKIVLKQNKINNVEELVIIISNFPKLKILNLEDNNIEKEKIEKVLEQLKEKGFKDLNIVYN